jgi:hypothetical protein
MEAVISSGQAVPRLVAVGEDSASQDPACLLSAAIGAWSSARRQPLVSGRTATAR